MVFTDEDYIIHGKDTVFVRELLENEIEMLPDCKSIAIRDNDIKIDKSKSSYNFTIYAEEN